MNVFVNQSQTAKLVGCSRANFSKMWKKEQEHPTSYSFFSPEGKININDLTFIENYGNHLDEYALKVKNPIKVPVKKTNKKIKKEKIEIKPEKKLTKKQETQKNYQEEKNKDELTNNHQTVGLREKAVQAGYTKKILEAQKIDLEIKKTRAELIELETLGDTCIGYLAALNQNIMEMPNSYVDEFEVAIKKKKSRTDKVQILTSPICEAISDTIKQIETELRRAKRNAK